MIDFYKKDTLYTDENYQHCLAYSNSILTGAELPYTELEYIESTGTQYIDTDIKSKITTKIEMMFQCTSYTDYSCLVGSVIAGNVNSRFYINQSNNKFNIAYGDPVIDTINVDNSIHTVVFNSISCLIDNNSYNVSSHIYNNNNLNIFLFAQNNSGSVSSKGNFKIFYCKIWDNDILVRDYIPVKDMPGITCLYDKVTKQFYYNKGTGRFWSNEEPPTYTELEYIQSSKTQYIDTGIYPNQNTRIKIKTKDITSGEIIVCATSAWTTNRFLLTYYGNAIRWYLGRRSNIFDTRKHFMRY